MSLERRTPLKRSGSLKRTAGNLKRSPLAPVSKRKQAAAAAERRVRLEVFDRDGHRCRLAGVEGCGPCFGRLTFHHRRKAGQGGAYSVANGAALCAGHNDLIEADARVAKIARRLGLVLLRTDSDDEGLPPMQRDFAPTVSARRGSGPRTKRQARLRRESVGAAVKPARRRRLSDERTAQVERDAVIPDPF